MDNRNWLDDPVRVTETNAVPLLPTTIKGLSRIAEDYARNGMRVMWRTTQFQYLAVVGRVLEASPRLVISDNTDTLIHECNKSITLPPLLLRHQYYRFIFEICPFANRFLTLHSVRPASPQAVLAHLGEAVGEDGKGQLHAELSCRREGEAKVEAGRDFKKQVREVITKLSKFTLQDLEQKVDCPQGTLIDILDELSGEGVIGDMGSYYLVADNSE